MMLLGMSLSAMAQTKFDERPKLVVGIVVDQMRWDYLSRYYDQFQPDGLKRLINEGYSCNNCLINYVPTVTAIGHTSAYTGTTPAYHGICGNTFYLDGKRVGCVADSTMQTIGSNTTKGKSSPHNLLATTIGDQLRLHTDFKAKVIGISFKDRAAILPAGRSANAAYWMDNKALCFVSSSYYMQELPDYAKKVNAQMANNKELKTVGQDISLYPLCGHLITDMAIAALKGENLGRNGTTDMLCVSYSQTDAIGHKWATRGEHTDEAYMELDKDIKRLLAALDAQVGHENYLLFLTADHGGAHNWKFMEDHKLGGGKWLYSDFIKQAEAHVAKTLGAKKNVIEDMLDFRLFLNHQSIAEQNLKLDEVKQCLVEFFSTVPNVIQAVDYQKLRTSSLPERIMNMALMGYHPRRSGDILIIAEPNYYEYGDWSSPVGTTHGSWNPYDAHIPLLFYGWHISQGATSREVHINDIAPTICQMLHIQQPNACSGEAILELTK
jgi:predicted AlkP superfamily pyrophosphatase or phosphodiesterase